MLTASHDLSLAYHRMAENGEQLVEKTLLKVQVENKINEIISTGITGSESKSDLTEVLVADVSDTISRFTVRY